MAESLKSKRVFFPKGGQSRFLSRSKDELGMSWKELAEVAGAGTKTLSGWRDESFTMSLSALRSICRKRKCPMPDGIELRDAYWYVSKGAKAGGEALLKKYGRVGGDEAYRKAKWREWWEHEGKFDRDSITHPAPFRKPRHSVALAEFVGIMLGDGGISEHQMTVTLNGVTDQKYLGFVRRLAEKLFDVPIGICSDMRSLAKRIVISRTALAEYLASDYIGLKKGNKVGQQVDIPGWIKKKRPYAIACLRGLIDTDGCAIIHQYRSKGTLYRYKKIGFTNHSLPILKSASDILSDLDVRHRITKNGWDIRIEARKDVDRYFQIVGTSNPKHWKRYEKA